MIDQVDDNLSKWVESVLSGLKPSMTPPADTNGTLGVNVYLLELVEDPLRQNTSQPPMQPALRYLVTTHADEPKDAHRLLGTLLFAAFAHNSYEVELTPLPHNTWSAFKIAPRPAFILRVPLAYQKEVEIAPVVRQGLSPQGQPMVPFFGVLLGPNGTPLANGRIELTNIYRYAYTDSRGRFELPGVPAAPSPKLIRIKARDRELLVTIRETGSAENPVTIHFDLFRDLVGQLVDARTNTAVTNAFVELPRHHRSAYSDEHGRFRLIGIPDDGPHTVNITYAAAGREQQTTQVITGAGSDQAPVIVRITVN